MDGVLEIYREVCSSGARSSSSAILGCFTTLKDPATGRAGSGLRLGFVETSISIFLHLMYCCLSYFILFLIYEGPDISLGVRSAFVSLRAICALAA